MSLLFSKIARSITTHTSNNNNNNSNNSNRVTTTANTTAFNSFVSNNFLSLALSATALYQWYQIRKLRSVLFARIKDASSSSSSSLSSSKNNIIEDVVPNLDNYDKTFPLELKKTTTTTTTAKDKDDDEATAAAAVVMVILGHLTIRGQIVDLFGMRLQRRRRHVHWQQEQQQQINNNDNDDELVRLSLCQIDNVPVRDNKESFSTRVAVIDLADGQPIDDIQPYLNNTNTSSSSYTNAIPSPHLPDWALYVSSLRSTNKKRLERAVRFTSYAEEHLTMIVTDGGLSFFRSHELSLVKECICRILSISGRHQQKGVRSRGGAVDDLYTQRMDNLLIYYHVVDAGGYYQVEVRLVKLTHAAMMTWTTTTAAKSIADNRHRHRDVTTTVPKKYLGTSPSIESADSNIYAESDVESFFEIMKTSPSIDSEDLTASPRTSVHDRQQRQLSSIDVNTSEDTTRNSRSADRHHVGIVEASKNKLLKTLHKMSPTPSHGNDGTDGDDMNGATNHTSTINGSSHNFHYNFSSPNLKSFRKRNKSSSPLPTTKKNMTNNSNSNQHNGDNVPLIATNGKTTHDKTPPSYISASTREKNRSFSSLNDIVDYHFGEQDETPPRSGSRAYHSAHGRYYDGPRASSAERPLAPPQNPQKMSPIANKSTTTVTTAESTNTANTTRSSSSRFNDYSTHSCPSPPSSNDTNDSPFDGATGGPGDRLSCTIHDDFLTVTRRQHDNITSDDEEQLSHGLSSLSSDHANQQQKYQQQQQSQSITTRPSWKNSKARNKMKKIMKGVKATTKMERLSWGSRGSSSYYKRQSRITEG